MAEYFFDQELARSSLKSFFVKERATINNFGSTVNQTFEAQVFANVIKWHRDKGWSVDIINPVKEGKQVFTLKFNTRGAPANYSYAKCKKNDKTTQIFCLVRTYLKKSH